MPPINPLEQLDSSVGAASQLPTSNNNDVNKTEFLELLVTQLQHQDPLDPMKNEEFAVQLAQFSQVEQLIAINDKLEPDAASGDFSSLASYLGQEIWLDSDVVEVRGGETEDIAFQLEQDAQNVEVQLVDAEGVVRESINVGSLAAGSHRVPLQGISSPSGNYQAQVVASGAGRVETNPEVSIAGTVNGYVPGPEPTLLIGDREVGTSEIKRVRVPA